MAVTSSSTTVDDEAANSALEIDYHDISVTSLSRPSLHYLRRRYTHSCLPPHLCLLLFFGIRPALHVNDKQAVRPTASRTSVRTCTDRRRHGALKARSVAGGTVTVTAIERDNGEVRAW